MELPGLENYLIHKDGRVYSKHVKRFMALRNANGYYCYILSLEDESGKRRVNISGHVLVARVYIPNPLNLPEVNHKDGNGYNNHVDNLEWITHKGNMEHASENGLISSVRR